MGDTILVVICLIAVVVLGGIGFASGAMGGSNRGANWGKNHMKDLGADEDKSDDYNDFKPVS